LQLNDHGVAMKFKQVKAGNSTFALLPTNKSEAQEIIAHYNNYYKDTKESNTYWN
jgi:hypothetical protein